ncbi:protein kinase domain-containing protein [Microcoleus sp. FACHB-672]|uniref:protein kinase domain-containing protein n=1 Tax=Microcoleus sp. FACHB-672 TaxID=2692825 RepID=UPI001689B5FF|nr:protein kinase [Microcoleus sp. FACHB-672]MBD2041637.1 protein kinase [Microcoleus sp. FACHB-672]
MSYCINPRCPNCENPDNLETCQSCGSSLLINDRYRVVKPLRELNPAYPTDIYEVKDLGGVDDWGTLKVLKVLKFNNPELMRLFKEEARALMFLRHRGIPRVEPDDYFTFSPNTGKQLPCLVMEKIEGENLADWLDNNGPISKKEALDWLQQLTEILDRVHEQNLLHRDIKPSNIIRKPNGRLALIDFGTVKVGNDGGTRVGTTGYAAPEQVIGQSGPRSDFYALGRTFVHLLTGIPPQEFSTDSNPETINWRESVKGLKPWTPLSKGLADLIDELKEPEPKNRPENTWEISKRLESIAKASDTPNSGFRKLKAALLSLGLITFPLIAPQIPVLVNHFLFPKLDSFFVSLGAVNLGEKNYKSAKMYYNLALKVNPNSGAARYSLGMICEVWEDYKCAKNQYSIATTLNDNNVATAAISNLSRLQILDGDSAKAVDLLMPNLERAEHPRVKAALYKNFGWARFEQTRYGEAETSLRKAIELGDKWASPHCLLAQVLEAQKRNLASLVEWTNCLNYLSGGSPEEDNLWKSMARQRLKDVEKKP